MATHDELEAAERSARKLLEDNDLPGPDEVQYEAGSVWLLWHDTKTAIVIDVDERA